MEKILLQMDGYWIDAYRNELPHEAGIYCVYACEPMAADKIAVLRELIYIGASDDVNAGIASHAQLDWWRERLSEGETLCYSFTGVNQDVRGRIAAAMVYHHRPPCNRVEGDFPFVDTSVVLTGEHDLLDDAFVVCGSSKV